MIENFEICPDLTVIVPSRGRPEAAAELVEAFRLTCTANTRLILAIDNDDPSLPAYATVGKNMGRPWRLWAHFVDQPSTMVYALNDAARYEVEFVKPFALGFMGDDHRPRTLGWDRHYLDALRELGTGIVYGNDLLQGERIPTQVAMTADIVGALGYMAPPVLRHMYVDNYWRDLGSGAGCLRYLQDVVVEHMHPVAGKSVWTEGHRRVNAPEVYQQDGRAYQAYIANQLWTDVATVKVLR